jgi:hypothetical protein
LIEATGVAEANWTAAACLVPRIEPGIRVSGRSEFATAYSLTFADIAEVDTLASPLSLPTFTPTDPGALP